jgi:hypothetical protein
MPLAALLPLGIITAALGVAGVGLSGAHYLFTGERNKPMTDRWKEALYDRDRMIKHHYG